MNLDDIKSPLPARPVAYIPEDEAVKPVLDGIRTNTPIAEPVSTTQPKAKKINIKLLLMIGGILIVIIILLILISSLVKKNGNGSGVTTLNYWGLWEDKTVMASVIADFEAQNPNIKINYKINQNDNYRSRLQGRLLKTGETTEEVPDIFRIHNTWIPMFREVLAKVPAQSATRIGLDTDFYNVYKGDLKENGSYLAIPLMYDGLAMFSNRDLLASAGITIPKSWWELETAAKKLTTKDENNKIMIAGAAVGTADNIDHWSDILGLMMKQNGVNFLKSDESNNTKIQDVLTYYTQFKTKDMVWDETLPNSTTYFANGKLAFYFGPSWRILNFESMNPNLNFDVNPVPQLPTLSSIEATDEASELTNIHWGSYWVEGVNNKSKNQDAAWKFLEYLASKEGLEKTYAAESQIRSFGEIYPRKSMASQLGANEKIKPFIDKADSATSWYLASRTNDEGVNDEMIKYFTDAVNSINQKQSTAVEVMADLRNGISQLIQKYKLIR